MSTLPAAAPPAGPAGEAPPPAASGDPVRALMAEHRELCEQAVDPLDIAAGLEDAGISSAVAGRYRHADVFALAEELYARVERRPAPPAPPCAAEAWPRQAGRALGVAALHLTAVAVLAALPWLAGVAGRPAAVAALLVAAGWAALAPLPGGSVSRPAYGLGMAALLAPGPAGGPALAAVVALGAGTAEFTARRLRQAGLDHLGSAGTADEFRARMRPLLPLAVAAQLVVAGAAAAVFGPAAAGAAGRTAAAALAAVLLLASVVRHADRPGAAAAAVAACGAGLGVLDLAVPAAGTAAVLRLAAVAAAGAALAPYAWSLLGRPQAYRASLRS